MATQVLNDFATALTTVFQPKLDRQFNRLAVLAGALPKSVGSGKNVSWDVRFSRTTHAANFTEGSDVGAGELNVDTTVPATLNWGLYRVAFGISGLSVAAAKSAIGSPLEVMALFEGHVMDAAADLISVINADLFTGDGSSTKIQGLYSGANAPILTTGSYAGLARATYAEWQSNLLANGGTPRALTKALMDDLEAQIFADCSMPPDLIVASPGIVRKYESLFDSVIRTAPAGTPQNSGDLSVLSRIQANSGYTGLSYKGIPILRDRNGPTGKLAMLNSSYVSIESLPQVELGDAVFSRSQGLGAEGAAPTGILAKIEPLAKTGDASKFQMVTYLQLKVRKPNACGAIVDLDET